MYTVKSGYRIALQKAGSTLDKPESSFKPNKHLWRVIWKLQVPPKIQNFWWRVCKNSLATKENLFRKRCAPSPQCPICNENVESVEHLLTQCPWSRPVWFGSDFNSIVAQEKCPSMLIWTSNIIDSSSNLKEVAGTIGKVAHQAWFIRKGYNDLVFNHLGVDPMSAVIRASKARSEFELISSVQSKVLEHPDVPPLASSAWRKPIPGSLM